MIWWQYALIGWALFVIGGWLNLSPRAVTFANFLYQLPTNWFFGINRTIGGTFDGDMSQTISSKLGRNYLAVLQAECNNSCRLANGTEHKPIQITIKQRLGVIAMRIVNIICVDPHHCIKYIGS